MDDSELVTPADRFKFEDLLMQQWQISDDLNLLAEQILEDGLDEDAVVNVLIGLAELHRLRCTKTNTMFEELVRDRKFT